MEPPILMDDDDVPSDNDYSNTTFINTIWVHREWDYITIEISIFLPIIVFGIFGNVLVIYVIARNRNVRSPTNLLLGNMAAADLLSLLLHPWVVLTYDFFQNYELGALGCLGDATIECCTLIASVVSMTAITYDRLTAIVLPQETRLTTKGAKIVIALTWLIGIVLSTPLVIYRTYKQRQWKNFLEKYCTENTVAVNIFWYIIITVLVWLPLSIQLICYISIFVKLDKYEKIIMRKFPNRQQVSYKKRAARMIFTVMLVFMICRLPFTAYIIYRHQLITNHKLGNANLVQNSVNGVYHTLWFASKCLILVNAMLNPLIYAVTNEKFQHAFKTTTVAKCLFSAARCTMKRRNICKVSERKAAEEAEAGQEQKENVFIITTKRQWNFKPFRTQNPT